MLSQSHGLGVRRVFGRFSGSGAGRHRPGIGQGVFLGTYEKQLDGKRRLQIPQELRSAPGVELGVFCFLAIADDCLEAGGDELTQLYVQRIEALPFGSAERDALEEAFYGGQRQLAYDGGGRIVLPEALCQAAGLSDDVVVVGKGRRFQIWDRARWQARATASRALAARTLKGEGV